MATDAFELHNLKLDIVYQMFVRTADQNYVMARTAYLYGYPDDFNWLLLHAVEKYIKASLLLNGRSSRNLSHDLIKLVEALTERFPTIDLQPAKPLVLKSPHGDDLPTFLGVVNRDGNPSQRYGTYKSLIDDTYLERADHLVWATRRLARLLHEPGDEAMQWSTALPLPPNEWILRSDLPLEVALRAQGGTRLAAVMMNNPAFSSYVHTDHGMNGLMFRAVPLSLARQWMADRTDPQKERLGREALTWAYDNIQYDSNATKMLKDVLGIDRKPM